MRVADKMNFDQVNANLGKNRSEMSELQNQAATQRRVTKPSDDPLAATRVLQARTEIGAGKQFIKSIAQARNFLEFSEQSLGELSETLMRAKELAINQASDASASQETRAVAALEIRTIFDQSVQIGNRKQGDRFLFGGFKTQTPPFDTRGNYHGDTGEMKIAINKEAKVAMNMSGDKIFLGTTTETPPAPIIPQKAEEYPGMDIPALPVNVRAPASFPPDPAGPIAEDTENLATRGTNVFKVLADLEVAMRANDKGGIQDSLDRIDDAISQVVRSRAQLGARVSTLTAATDSLQKGQVDSKTLASNLEDADTFELVSDINKTESTLKASLMTSGKLIQPSLLDFLK